MNQQGTFFSAGCSLLLLVKTGVNLHRYQLLVTLLTTFFFLSFLFLIYNLSKLFHTQDIWGLIAFITMWVAADFVPPSEGFLYLVGACVYALPLSLGFLASAFYLRLMNADTNFAKALYIILSAGCAIACSGGVLIAAAMINIFMVCIFLLKWAATRKLPIRGILPFLCAFGSALMNTIAPGNYVRFHSEVASHMNLVSSVINTFLICLQQIYHLFTHTYLLIGLTLIALFVCIIPTEKTASDFRIHPLFVIFSTVVCCYIVLFPSVLGYQLQLGTPIEQRILFAFSWISSLCIVFAWTYTLLWVKVNKFNENTSREGAITLSAIALFVALVLNLLYVPAMRMDSRPTLTTIFQEYRSGALQQHYAAYHLLLLGAEAAEQGSHYVVTYEIPPSPLFMDHHLSADNTWWVNTTLAAVYQLGAFTYGPDHPFTEEDALAAGYTIEQLLP